MKTIQSFEKKMREANYVSLDEARAGIRIHPLVADYLIDLLVERKVLTVRDDGRVIGVSKDEGRDDPKTPKSTEWKTVWPDRKRLIDWLATDDWENERGESCPFRKLQENLKEDGQVHSHWFCLHALWNLMEAGVAEKHGGGYRLTDSAQKAHNAEGERNRQILTDCLRRIGPPYDAKKFITELKQTPDHEWLKDGEEFFSQEYVTGLAQGRKEKGLI